MNFWLIKLPIWVPLHFCVISGSKDTISQVRTLYIQFLSQKIIYSTCLNSREIGQILPQCTATDLYIETCSESTSTRLQSPFPPPRQYYFPHPGLYACTESRFSSTWWPELRQPLTPSLSSPSLTLTWLEGSIECFPLKISIWKPEKRSFWSLKWMTFYFLLVHLF